MKHCCIKMEGALEEPGTPVRYVPYTRSYYIEYETTFINKDTNEVAFGLAEPLFYCPWCGIKFPKRLNQEWRKIVTNKFNIKSNLDKEELKKLPEEYMTEEWWKKKGL